MRGNTTGNTSFMGSWVFKQESSYITVLNQTLENLSQPFYLCTPCCFCFDTTSPALGVGRWTESELALMSKLLHTKQRIWLWLVSGHATSFTQVSKKAYDTWYSQVVSHPSPNQAQPCLASEIRWDQAFSGRYGCKQVLEILLSLIRQEWGYSLDKFLVGSTLTPTNSQFCHVSLFPLGCFGLWEDTRVPN